MSVVSYTLSALVGLVFIVTGAIKLREGRGALSETITTFRVAPRSFVPVIAAVLPPVELTIGLCLVAGVSGPWGAAAAALVLVYTAAVVSVIVRNIATDCGCFGSVLRSQANWSVVARNGVLLLALVPALILPTLTFIDAWIGWVLTGLGFVVGLIRMFGADRRSPAQPAEEPAAPQSRVAVQQIGDSSWT